MNSYCSLPIADVLRGNYDGLNCFKITPIPLLTSGAQSTCTYNSTQTALCYGDSKLYTYQMGGSVSLPFSSPDRQILQSAMNAGGNHVEIVFSGQQIPLSVQSNSKTKTIMKQMDRFLTFRMVSRCLLRYTHQKPPIQSSYIQFARNRQTTIGSSCMRTTQCKQ